MSSSSIPARCCADTTRSSLFAASGRLVYQQSFHSLIKQQAAPRSCLHARMLQRRGCRSAILPGGLSIIVFVPLTAHVHCT